MKPYLKNFLPKRSSQKPHSSDDCGICAMVYDKDLRDMSKGSAREASLADSGSSRARQLQKDVVKEELNDALAHEIVEPVDHIDI